MTHKKWTTRHVSVGLRIKHFPNTPFLRIVINRFLWNSCPINRGTLFASDIDLCLWSSPTLWGILTALNTRHKKGDSQKYGTGTKHNPCLQLSFSTDLLQIKCSQICSSATQQCGLSWGDLVSLYSAWKVSAYSTVIQTTNFNCQMRKL
jgi:hypothetical protein